MSSDLANRLNAEGHRRFVGRIAERDLLRSALAADEPPINVLYVFEPGGLGKSTCSASSPPFAKSRASRRATWTRATSSPPPTLSWGRCPLPLLRQLGEIPPSGQGSS